MTSSSIPVYSKTFEGNIWQIKLNNTCSKLVVSHRPEKELHLTYVIISLDDLSEISIKTPDQIGWRSSLLAIDGDELFINKHEGDKNPGLNTLHVMNYRTGSINSTYPEVLIESLDAGGILGKFKTSEESAHKLKLPFKDIAKGQIQDPVIYTENSEGFQMIKDFLAEDQIVPIHLVEYLERNGHLIFSYHTAGRDGIKRNLVWFKDDELLFHERIDTQMSGIATESFITTKNYLIFVVDRRELRIHAL